VGNLQILLWTLMREKQKMLVYLYVKLSILNIGGARLIFINTIMCPFIPAIKKSKCSVEQSLLHSIRDSSILTVDKNCLNQLFIDLTSGSGK